MMNTEICIGVIELRFNYSIRTQFSFFAKDRMLSCILARIAMCDNARIIVVAAGKAGYFHACRLQSLYSRIDCSLAPTTQLLL